MKLLILSSILFTFIISCNTDENSANPLYDITEMWEAHHSSQWDSLSTANQLIGVWKLIYYDCEICNDPNEQQKAGENLIVKFYPDGTLELFQDDALKQQSTWFVKIKDVALYGLVVDPPLPQLYGRILFNEDKVLFNNSYIDGGDNFFTKISLIDQTQ